MQCSAVVSGPVHGLGWLVGAVGCRCASWLDMGTASLINIIIALCSNGHCGHFAVDGCSRKGGGSGVLMMSLHVLLTCAPYQLLWLSWRG